MVLLYELLNLRATSTLKKFLLIQKRRSRSGAGSMRHHFNTWIGHQSVQSLNSLRIFGMFWKRIYPAVRLFHHQWEMCWGGQTVKCFVDYWEDFKDDCVMKRWPEEGL